MVGTFFISIFGNKTYRPECRYRNNEPSGRGMPGPDEFDVNAPACAETKRVYDDDALSQAHVFRACLYLRYIYCLNLHVPLFVCVQTGFDAVQLGLHVQVGNNVSAVMDGMHLHQVSWGSPVFTSVCNPSNLTYPNSSAAMEY